MELISREDAIEAIEELVSTMSVCVSMEECRGMNGMKRRAIAAIEALPTAERVGKWTRHLLKNANVPWGYDCSACGEWFVISEDAAGRYNYCPNCGARMTEGEEDE